MSSSPISKRMRESAEGCVVMWFRNDLRCHDNSALRNASVFAKERNIPVKALYLFAPEEWESHDLAPVKLDFIKRTLVELGGKLEADFGIPLNTLLVPAGAHSATIAADFAQAEGAVAVFYNIEYEVDEGKRDAQFNKLAEKHGIAVNSCHDQCVVPPGVVLNQAGTMSKVFTPFKKAWIKHLQAEGFDVAPFPHKQTFVKKSRADPFPEIKIEDELRKSANDEWPAGEDAAVYRMQQFLKEHGESYKEKRDFPITPGTSRISAYLAIGSLSVRSCLQAALEYNHHKYDSGKEGVVHWISELCWREFYRNILFHFPQVCRGQPFQPLTNQVAWRGRAPGEDAKAEADFEAWKQGKTGYPLVDAAMRCLLATGWMHNRLRMLSAMFLTKDLLIWWPRGESFFMRHLVDGDFCSNNGGWQWSASTGTDSQPYFRIFNPLLQSEKFDAKGEFIKRWVPELQAMDAKVIHAPYERLPKEQFEKLGYPRPIVDHNQARKRCLDAFIRVMKK